MIRTIGLGCRPLADATVQQPKPAAANNERFPLSIWSWQSIPWHPTGLAAAVVLAFWIDAGVSPYAAFRSLLIAALLAGAATVVVGAATRNRHLGGVAATAIIALLYSKHVVRLVVDTGPRMPTALMVIWLLAMVLASVLAVRLGLRFARRMSWPDTTSVLNRIAAVLLVATAGVGLLNGSFAHAFGELDQGGGLDAAAGERTDPRPDIYVLLVDGYPRADVLQHAFDLDNSPFVTALGERGFQVATDSHSDYLWTHLSLTSMLQMEYIEHIKVLEPVVEGRAPLYPPIYDAVNHNPVFDEARREGYQVVGISGGFEQLAPRHADVFLDGDQMTEFELKLLNSTFLGQVVTAVAPSFAATQHAERIRSSLALVASVAQTPSNGPRLVVAHIPTPHQPTVFRRDGDVIPVPIDDYFYADGPLERGEPLGEFVSKYRAHLAYLNEILLATVDSVIEGSAVPPVIVLVADHGSASRVDWTATTPTQAAPADLLERTGTLFSALTPGKSEVFPDGVSPVDVFRHLFDAYGGTSFGAAVPPPGGGQIPPVDASVFR